MMPAAEGLPLQAVAQAGLYSPGNRSTIGLSPHEYASQERDGFIKLYTAILESSATETEADCARQNIANWSDSAPDIHPHHFRSRDPFTLAGFTERDVLEGAVPHVDWHFEGVCEPCGLGHSLFLGGNSDLGIISCEECRLNYIAGTIDDFDAGYDSSIEIKKGCRDVLRARAAHSSDCVYFVEGGGLIKIGRATDLYPRLSGLATGSPVPLRLIATAGPACLELHYHKLFAKRRERLEWFSISREEAYRAPGVIPVEPDYEDPFFADDEVLDDPVTEQSVADRLAAMKLVGGGK